uniref:Partner of Inscuteable n=1 Tax=Drosophila melanogaster TaxID=7227 RepID=UPI000277547C|nr:Chain B, Partner of Inscuteable [Drosophila melanogaster]
DHSASGNQSDGSENSQGRMVRVRRQDMEQLDLIKITPDGKRMQEEKLRAQ